jgi:hypothetical protein
MPEEATPAKVRLTDGLGPLGETRALVERLRFLASGQDDAQSVALAEAAAELELLAAHIEKVEAWQREGEAMMDGKTPGAMFSLGAWWADRPWRERA